MTPAKEGGKMGGGEKDSQGKQKERRRGVPARIAGKREVSKGIPMEEAEVVAEA
jgi:hypothetical protein